MSKPKAKTKPLTAIEVKAEFKRLKNEVRQAETKVMGWRIAFIRGDTYDAGARWEAWKDELKVRQKAFRTFGVKNMIRLTDPEGE